MTNAKTIFQFCRHWNDVIIWSFPSFGFLKLHSNFSLSVWWSINANTIHKSQDKEIRDTYAQPTRKGNYLWERGSKRLAPALCRLNQCFSTFWAPSPGWRNFLKLLLSRSKNLIQWDILHNTPNNHVTDISYIFNFVSNTLTLTFLSKLHLI
jgi:hypothetical protein